jgi:stage III sporulation protein AF
MINFLSSWAEQVILAVIIATILELILPNSKNKKYVQMVIGVYVLFNIISPIIKNKEKLVFSEIDLDKYITTSTKVEQSSMDARLEKIYLDELENNIKSKFKNVGIEIIKCTIDAGLDTTKKNAGIHSIDVKVKNVDDEQKISKIKQEIIEEYEISEDKIKIIIK